MKKYLSIFLAALLASSGLTGSAAPNGNRMMASNCHDTPSAATPSNAYVRLTGYKTENYSQQSVAEFNASLRPDNGDLSELLEAYTAVTTTLAHDDENYHFITQTLAASLNELYGEQMNEEVGMSGYVTMRTSPVKPLPEETDFSREEAIYDFIFYAFYTLQYTIHDPSALTVAERDHLLQTFCTELQTCVDGFSEEEITDGNIRRILTLKAAELTDNLSSDRIRLSCEISEIEIHNGGIEFTP